MLDDYLNCADAMAEMTNKILSPAEVAEIQARHDADHEVTNGLQLLRDRAALLASHEALRAELLNRDAIQLPDKDAELDAAHKEIARLRDALKLAGTLLRPSQKEWLIKRSDWEGYKDIVPELLK